MLWKARGGGRGRGRFPEVAPQSLRLTKKEEMTVRKRDRNGDHEVKHQSSKVRSRKLTPSFSHLLSVPLLLRYLQDLQNSRKKSIKTCLQQERGKERKKEKSISPCLWRWSLRVPLKCCHCSFKVQLSSVSGGMKWSTSRMCHVLERNQLSSHGVGAVG